MRVPFNLVLVVGIVSLFFIGCRHSSKEIARDSLDSLKGQYNGKVTYIYKYSKLNIGIEDKQKSEECNSLLITDTNPPSLTITSLPDSVTLHIDIRGFNHIVKGSAFYIPAQLVRYKSSLLTIHRNLIIGDAASKGDGFVDETGNLTFSIAGLLPIRENGTDYNMPFEAYYILNKIPDDEN